MPCSYCAAGLNSKKPLGSATPKGDLAKNIETNVDDALHASRQEDIATETLDMVSDDHSTFAIEDAMNCDGNDDFNIAHELWQYE